MKTQIEKLKKFNPCPKALDYADKFNSLQEAWDNCERGDWMLWLLGKLSGNSRSKSRKELVWIACQCARLSLQYIAKDEKRPLIAIETAEKWTKGLATLQQVRVAADAAYAAYAAAHAAYAAAAAAAAYAAYAAAAAYVAAAAYAAADAAYDAAAADAAAAAYDAAAADAAYDAAAADAAAAAYDAAAADAAYDAAAADAAAAAAYAAKKKVLKQCADIVREYHPLIKI